ncbi:hypothetical protein JK358_35645 [Nocardia sp. 2]|uniref:Uncharacterized protein n=1 Tax=Nocardia acididurans TaxID=2802282 RepID=A0ABS1MJ97_9NOCA|nr:hypothetical protein [Nocardia acididurans]MBL1079749.1 hypothetical protein [Nocardia acididurans]
MAEVIKVFTPIKRVPVMVGKAQNGQKLPFGPYTLPQIGAGTVLLLLSCLGALNLPANPAVTFLGGLAITVTTVLGLGLIPYTGVRLTSRILWLARLLINHKPVAASGIPVTAESARTTVIIEESVVLVLPAPTPAKTLTASPLPATAAPNDRLTFRAIPPADHLRAEGS